MATFTIAELMTWALYETSLKAYLGVTGTSEDFELELWLGAMTEVADHYIEAEFETLPKTVEVGVYSGVKVIRTRQPTDGFSGVKTRDLEVNFSVSKATFAVDAGFGASREWFRFVKNDRSLDGK